MPRIATILKYLLYWASVEVFLASPIGFVLGFLLGAVLFVAFHVALFQLSKPLFAAVMDTFVDHFDIWKDGLYLRRYYLVPRIRDWRRPFLHHILKSDKDRHPHDHPWGFETHILAGAYIEHVWFPLEYIAPETDIVYDGDAKYYRVGKREWMRIALAGSKYKVPPTHTHKVEIIEPVWSLFVSGPQVREWGFWEIDPEDPSKDKWTRHDLYLEAGEEVKG